MDMTETYRPVKDYEDEYEISNLGNLRRIFHYKNGQVKHRPCMLSMHNRGYHMTGLCKSGIKKNALIHRLVAQAFVPNPKNYKFIICKDSNKLNDKADNLQWVEDRYEVVDNARSNGIQYSGTIGKTCQKKLSVQHIREIRCSTLSNATLSQHYKVSPNMIWMIRNNKRRQNVK